MEIATYENGVGYSKSFSTGKSVNTYVNVPENPINKREYGGGIDVNINGYGGSIQAGSESAIAVHVKDNSFELGITSSGRLYGKHTYSAGDGHAYNKLSINLPEVLGMAVLAICVSKVEVELGVVGAIIQIFG